MPTYFYHIKFELYPTANPVACSERRALDGQGGTASQPTNEIWLPAPGADIFDELPSHPGRREPKNKASIASGSRFHPQPQHSSQSKRITNRHVESSPSSPSQSGPLSVNVIDCGPSRAQVEEDNGKNIELLSRHQWKARTKSLPPPPASAAIKPQTAVRDWRFGWVRVASLDPGEDKVATTANMAQDEELSSSSGAPAATGIGPMFSGVGTATKAKCIPLDFKNTDMGWGIVHFYREGEDSPGLRIPPAEQHQDDQSEEECTTLCIPAVPSYWTPGDFLGFIGDKWKEGISHYRIVMTEQLSRYLPQIFQVVFVKSITFETPMAPSSSDGNSMTSSSPMAVLHSLKPFPPPTPNLIELPTCAVCLERMDDTTGLMTIPCQHIFHCACLENWKSPGCPVCRHTSDNPDFDPSNPYTQPFGSPVSNLCSVCDSTDDLWICLICGRVGCGRYKGGHAKDHWKETAHSFALEIETQHVWDYAGDTWVHRLIREKGDGKLVELPGKTGGPQDGPHQRDDVVPRAKLENMGQEYAHLLSSQLESQRVYFEEMMSKLADKAAKATATAEAALKQAESLRTENAKFCADLERLQNEVIPQLERDSERDRKKAEKAQELARNMGKALQEEKEVSKGLMKRVEHNAAELGSLRARDQEQQAKIAELEDMNRDLTMFISGQEKLKELEAEGQVEAGELAEGSASVPERKGKRKGKK
ncbi:RING finger protein [Sodiomyces alkalinus F11]|uniref:RING finger protein n=1 Tax=Sodiomyces alkalinus (strain CBS 110278 / VKM F-3762 / F11) TaxID=1314773 RepID=A0A3N2PQ38_SODAK|nr:RING finger protein [Sodiomyces alkalinus F11]ROT36619.1 RING finger protein [Sodiomyces alkalinus F11]